MLGRIFIGSVSFGAIDEGRVQDLGGMGEDDEGKGYSGNAMGSCNEPSSLFDGTSWAQCRFLVILAYPPFATHSAQGT